MLALSLSRSKAVGSLAALLVASVVCWAPSVSAQACVGNMPAPNGNTCRETVAVNASSFLGPGSGLLWASTFEVERLVRNSARAWSQFASARRGFEYVGTTSAMGCGSGFKHLVTGVIGVCVPTSTCDCSLPQHQWTCVGGVNYPCSGESHFIQINVHPMQAPVQLNMGYPGALQGVITHELGHALTASANGGHVPTNGNQNVMQSSSPLTAGISFGPEDISATGSQVGTGIEYATRYRSSVWPQPTTLNSWYYVDWVPSQWGTVDLAHGFVSGSGRRTSWFVADTNSVVGGDIDQAWGQFPGPSGTTRRRVSTLYEPEHQQWWLTRINSDNTISVFRTPDRVNWTSLGLLTRPSGTSTFTSRSRFPVALAYEPGSDRVVLTYTNFASGSTSGCDSLQTLCDHEVQTIALAWNSTNATVAPDAGTNFTRWADPNYPTVVSAAAVGPPAMACSTADSSGRNCEILYTSWTPDRAMGFVRFKVDGSGISNRTLPQGFAGYTDDPISYESNSAGVVAAACTGLNSNVWVASKYGIGGSGFAWNQVSGPLVSKKGPILRSHPEPYFDILLFPN